MMQHLSYFCINLVYKVDFKNLNKLGILSLKKKKKAYATILMMPPERDFYVSLQYCLATWY
jgi:hypothetical protein